MIYTKEKRSYVKPELEAVWMEAEDMIAATGEGVDQGWEGLERPNGTTGNVKRNVVRTNQWDDWDDEEEEDDGWVY